LEDNPSLETRLKGSRLNVNNNNGDGENGGVKHRLFGMGPGGRGRGAARFDLLDARLETFKRHIGLPVLGELTRSMNKQFRDWWNDNGDTDGLLKGKEGGGVKESSSSPQEVGTNKHLTHSNNNNNNNNEKSENKNSQLKSQHQHDNMAGIYNENVVQKKAREAREKVKLKVETVSGEVKEATDDVREATSAFGNCAQWTSSGVDVVCGCVLVGVLWGIS
jgi:hypothetical protein